MSYRSTLTLRIPRQRPSARAADFPLSGAHIQCLDSTQNTGGRPMLLAGFPEIHHRFDQVGFTLTQWSIHRNHLWRYGDGGWQYLGAGGWVYANIWQNTTAGQYGTGFWQLHNGQWLSARADWSLFVESAYYAVIHDVYWLVGGGWSAKESVYGAHFDRDIHGPGQYATYCGVG